MCVSVIQGARVWVKEKEQLVPATVNSCGDGTLVVTTDYGEVRNLTSDVLKAVLSLSVLLKCPVSTEPKK